MAGSAAFQKILNSQRPLDWRLLDSVRSLAGDPPSGRPGRFLGFLRFLGAFRPVFW